MASSSAGTAVCSRGAPDGPRRSRAGCVIDGRELVDRALQLLGGRRRFHAVPRGAAAGRGAWRDRPDRRQGKAHDHDAVCAHVSQSIDLRASCRYACSFRGNATGYTPV